MRKRLVAILLVVVMVVSINAPALAYINKLSPSLGKPALVFEQEKSWAKWRKSGGKVQITFNMENLDPDATIDAFDLVIYCENAYEEIIYPTDLCDGEYMHQYTLNKTIKPGKTGYSGYCSITGTSGIKYIYAAVKRYHYKIGSSPSYSYATPSSTNTVEISDSNLDWLYWEYK